MTDDLKISVATQEAATQLQQDFDELLARVNGDMIFVSMNAHDPISVESAIISAERSIDSHMAAFPNHEALRSLLPDLKRRFREDIERQAEAAARK